MFFLGVWLFAVGLILVSHAKFEADFIIVAVCIILAAICIVGSIYIISENYLDYQRNLDERE